MLDIYYGELKMHVSKQQKSYTVEDFLSKYFQILDVLYGMPICKLHLSKCLLLAKALLKSNYWSALSIQQIVWIKPVNP